MASCRRGARESSHRERCPIGGSDGRAVAAREPAEFEEVVPQEREARTYVTLRAPLYDSAGRLTGTCAASVDITERQRLMELLRREKEAAEALLQEQAAHALSQLN